jgi:hypothetical protein
MAERASAQKPGRAAARDPERQRAHGELVGALEALELDPLGELKRAR